MRFSSLAIILLASTITMAAGKEAPITEQELVRRTQELYDAVAAGNQAHGSNILPMIARSQTRRGERWIRASSLPISLLCRLVTLA
jgi:hypothetical protein